MDSTTATLPSEPDGKPSLASPAIPGEAPASQPYVGLANIKQFFWDIYIRERHFLGLMATAFVLVGVLYENASIARWVGFLIAGYAAVANDSIQTIGTFISSNRNRPWWMLWIFIGGIFLITVSYSWFTYNGDVSYQRLAAKGFETAPTSFSYLQVASPLLLLILTRMRMPVSTTFLLLSSFATTASSVGSVLFKSLSGYAIAFVGAMVIWSALSPKMEKWFTGEAHPIWTVFQWATSGALWSVWIMQDAANIAVFLPRSLSVLEFAVFAGVIFFGLGFLFRMGGDRVQKVVDEKSGVVDVRPAAVINLVYAVILYYFKIHSKVPMSTTWVFIGLLGGRELAMAWRSTSDRSLKMAAGMLIKDLGFAGFGLLVSLILAFSVNDAFHQGVMQMFRGLLP